MGDKKDKKSKKKRPAPTSPDHNYHHQRSPKVSKTKMTTTTATFAPTLIVKSLNPSSVGAPSAILTFTCGIPTSLPDSFKTSSKVDKDQKTVVTTISGGTKACSYSNVTRERFEGGGQKGERWWPSRSEAQRIR